LHLRLLGSAAGGGVPQWNCACGNCRAARAGRISRRTQCSIAVSADGTAWFLINASPDLREQIEAFSPLQPSGGSARGSPVEAVLLTNADLDHSLGVLLLREGGAARLHASAGVRDGLAWLAPMLEPFGGVVWTEPQALLAPLLKKEMQPSGLEYRFIPLKGNGKAGEAFLISDDRTHGKVLVASDVAALDEPLRDAMDEADAVFFDGTFWSAGELAELAPGKRSAYEMGHLPISDGGLDALSNCKARHRILVHINNTNPILDPASPQRAAVEAAGVAVGHDGMELIL
jgi:pyrroloquinoline quinone biosynthesis protein B